jgi:type II secretory pathway pseudopilin PulG
MKHLRFTLIELLVVICIILILASLLIPVLGKASRKSKLVICFNNCKQMAMGTMIYAQGNRSVLPPSSDKTYSKKSISWDDYIGPMMGIPMNLEQQQYNGIKVSMKIPSGATMLCPLGYPKTKNSVEEINYDLNGSQYSVNSAADPFQGRSYAMSGQIWVDPKTNKLGIGTPDGMSCSLASIRKSPSEVFVLAERYTSARGASDSSNTGIITSSYSGNNGLHTDKPGFFVATLADGGTAFIHRNVLAQYQNKWDY